MATQAAVYEKKMEDSKNSELLPASTQADNSFVSNSVDISYSNQRQCDVAVASAVAPVVRELIAKQVSRNNVSLTNVNDVINDTLQMVHAPPVVFSETTAARCCVEIDICLNHLTATESIAHSEFLGFGCDETPHQSAGRSFLEIHCFGVKEGVYWLEFIQSIELYGDECKTAAATLSHLVETYDYLKRISKNTNFPEFHRFHILSYDNCATNTGKFEGLGVLFDESRRKDYNKFIALKNITDNNYPFLATITLGCKDHEAALFGKTFSTRLEAYLKDIGRKDLISHPKGIFIGFSLLKLLSIYLGLGAPHRGNEFQGHCKRIGIKEKIFFRVTKNRYCTYELLAKNIGIHNNTYRIIH